MRILFCAASLLCAVNISAETAGEATYACEYRSAKHATAGNAEIKLQNGEVRSVDYGNTTKGWPGQPGYACVLSADRADKQQKWTVSGSTTTVEFLETAESQRNLIVIARNGRGFLIDMRNARSNTACGAGSALPDSVQVPLKGKKCVVEFWH